MYRSSRSDVEGKDNRLANEDVLLRYPDVVNLVTSDGQNVVSTAEALQMARDSNLDLVEIDSSSNPPICKMLDLRKLKYTLQKNASEARKKQKSVEIKEVKIRPVINSHDYDVKVKAIVGFLNNGCKVKITLKLRGREIIHPEFGYEMLNKIKEHVVDVSKIDYGPKLDGRQMIMILSPK